MSFSFENRVAVVTGAGGNPGLGRTYARLLAERGAKVIVNDLGLLARDGASPEPEAAERVAAEIRAAGGDAVADTNSVAERDGCERIVESAISTYGRLDILINNAGIAPSVTFPDLTNETIQKIVDTHLMGHIWMCRAAWPHMVKQRYGRIVNVGSALALRGNVVHPIYAGVKLGIVGLSLALAQEGHAHGIKVNTLLPSAQTLGRPSATDDLGPDRVAPVAALLSHESCAFSGRSLSAGGGAVQEVRFTLTDGIDHREHLTMESLQASLTEVFDVNHASLVDRPPVT